MYVTYMSYVIMWFVNELELMTLFLVRKTKSIEIHIIMNHHDIKLGNTMW